MNRAFVCLGAVLAAYALTARPLCAQAYVSPLVVEASPGIITVANGGAQPLRLLVEAADFDQDAGGRVLFGPLGRSRHSCGERLRVSEAPTQAPARSEIRLSVTVAAGSDPCWGAVLIQLSTGLAPGARVGVQVYAIPAGAARSARVTAIDLVGDTLRAELANDGPTPLRPHGRIEVRTPQGETVATQAVPAFGLHPGVRRTVAVPLSPRPAAGPYVVLAVFDIGLPDYVAGEARIELPPARSPR